MKVCNMDDGSVSQREGTLLNTIETAFSGSRSLKCVIKPVARGEKVMVYKKTYCRPADFHDSRYDPAFSPLIYPGQTLHAAVRVNGEEYGVKACLYVHGDNGSRYYYGSWKEITPGYSKWQLSMRCSKIGFHGIGTSSPASLDACLAM